MRFGGHSEAVEAANGLERRDFHQENTKQSSGLMIKHIYQTVVVKNLVKNTTSKQIGRKVHA